MTQLKFLKMSGLILLSIAFLMSSMANADKPSWAEGSEPEKQQQKRHKIRERHGYQYTGRSNQGQDRSQYSGGKYFNDRDRSFANGFFAKEYQTGHCPPGLNKKSNGCLPPGQAKKWMIGQPMPQEVVYYDLPPDLARLIGMPPPGYRFVRVASDILLITIGSGIVMDAIYDLGLM
jgi:Ni/Co efflux regulator RcnB